MPYRVSRLFAKNSGIVGLLSILLFPQAISSAACPRNRFGRLGAFPLIFYPGIAAGAAVSSFWSPEWIGSRLSASVAKSEGKTKALRKFPKRFLFKPLVFEGFNKRLWARKNHCAGEIQFSLTADTGSSSYMKETSCSAHASMSGTKTSCSMPVMSTRSGVYWPSPGIRFSSSS